MTTTQETNTVTTKPNFGNGRYSDAMEALYNDMQHVLGIEAAKAEKIARMAGSDAGAIMANASVNLKFGKVTGKDKLMTLSEAAKVKGVRPTNALMIARAIQWWEDAGANGLRWDSSIKLSQNIQEWVDNMTV